MTGSIIKGFRDEIEKIAVPILPILAGVGLAGAAGYGAYKAVSSTNKKKKAYKKKLTGTYQPGAGMIAPPRAY